MKIIYENYIITLTLSIVLLFAGFTSTFAQDKKKDEKTNKSDTTEVKTPYEKLFDKKRNVKTSKGILTLHQVDGKLYLEVPVEQMCESYLMSSVVENASDLGLSYVGQRISRPLHITFSKTDSLAQIRAVHSSQLVDSNDSGIKQAVELSSVPPIIYSAPILAFNSDSSAVVFEATSFFVSGSKFIGKLNASSFGGFIQKISTFSKELSEIKDVKAFENNVSILSDMTYTFKTSFLGMESPGKDYLTVELKTTLELLPKEPFTPRIADYRIGTSTTRFNKLSSVIQGEQTKYFANRWRIEPVDKNAYFNGELSKPVKPIVFYVDTLFSPSWREAVKRGLLKWNSAFEKTGYKDVIEVHDFPSAKEDSLFDASNISFNCVRYAQLPSRSIINQVNTDPRSGEILSASILFFRDAPVTLQRERIYQTAEVEPRVRSHELPDDLMCEALEMATAKEMGYCLGLTDNFAASSWMSVDSLRSNTFTDREGITSSIMDQIRYNYVARPGDIEKGVEIAARNLGVYDDYVIDWLYKTYPNTVNESDALRKIIEEKASDRRFLYGKKQSWSAWFDPRSMVEDLSNDKIAATEQGVKTLKYISENGASWINKDNVEETYKELFVDFIYLKLYDYYRSILVNIGGIEINPRYEGDPAPSYVPVSREIQKESLKYILYNADNLEWLNNPEILKMSGMNANLSNFFGNNLVILPLQRIAMVAFAQQKPPLGDAAADYEGPYTVDEMLGDIMEFALQNVRNGKAPSEAQKALLFASTQLLLHNSNLPKIESAKAKNSSAFQLVEPDNYYSYENLRARCYPNEIITDNTSAMTARETVESSFSGSLNQIRSSNIDPLASSSSSFDVLTTIKYLTNKDQSEVFYKHLLSTRKELRRGSKRAKDEIAKSQIEYLIQAIDKGLGN